MARILRRMSRWKKFNPAILPIASAMAFGLAASAPAHAAVAEILPLTLAAAPSVACVSLPFQESALPKADSTRALKSAAILGGAPSALERIRMSQAAAGVSGANTTSLAQPTNPGNANACPAGTWSPEPSVSQAASLMNPVAATSPLTSRSDVFLASPRIAIGRTRFDAEWARVQATHLSARQVERTMGAPEADPLAMLEQVNRWANRTIAYRADSGGDYWADAKRTLRTKAGDCEDIAIVKYQALLSLGVNPSDIYFTIAHDLVRHADHALLVVRQGSQYFLLDNSSDALLDGSRSNDYRPILSFGQGKWLHGIQVATPSQTAIYLSRNELSSPRVIGLIR